MRALTKDGYLALLQAMQTIRVFEEQVEELFRRAIMPGRPHSYRGQEACAVGVCSVLEAHDLVLSYHRGDGHMIARGLDLYTILAELLGRRDGYSKGKGGPMHMADPEKGFLGTNTVVGASVPIAAGAALAAQMRKSGQVVVSFSGEGAANQGAWHEALNLAGLWHLPVVFVCENNLYAFSVPQSRSMAIPHIADRAAAYGFPGQVVDGNDVLAVREAAARAVDRARSDQGPTLLELMTYRWDGHYGGDPADYRPGEEVEAWKGKDPIPRYRRALLENGWASPEEIDPVVERATALVEDVVRRALESPPPPLEEATTDLFVEA